MSDTSKVVNARYHFDWLSAQEVQLLCKTRGLVYQGSKDELARRVIEYENENDMNCVDYGSQSGHDGHSGHRTGRNKAKKKNKNNKNEKNGLDFAHLTLKSLKAELKLIGFPTNGTKDELVERLSNNSFHCYEEIQMNDYCDSLIDSINELKHNMSQFNSYLKHNYINDKEKQNLFLSNNSKVKTTSNNRDGREDASANMYEDNVMKKLAKNRDYMSQTEWKRFNNTLHTLNSDTHALKLEIADYTDIEVKNKDIQLYNSGNLDGLDGLDGLDSSGDGMDSNDEEMDGMDEDKYINDKTLYIVYNDSVEMIMAQRDEMIVGAFRSEQRAEDIVGLNENYAVCDVVIDNPDANIE